MGHLSWLFYQIIEENVLKNMLTQYFNVIHDYVSFVSAPKNLNRVSRFFSPEIRNLVAWTSASIQKVCISTDTGSADYKCLLAKQRESLQLSSTHVQMWLLHLLDLGKGRVSTIPFLTLLKSRGLLLVVRFSFLVSSIKTLPQIKVNPTQIMS